MLTATTPAQASFVVPPTVAEDPMLRPETDYVQAIAAERGVQYVRLWFVDVLGILKSVSIPISELEVALEDGVGIDGSALEGAERPHERDVIAIPDAETFAILPWHQHPKVGRLFCDLTLPDGAPASGDPRHALRRVLGQAAELGYSLQVGAEIEFFLFEPDVGDAPPVPLDRGAYFDLTPLDAGSEFRRRTVEHCEAMGIPVKAFHHEAAPSQHEVDLEHDEALAMADAITTFRMTVKEVARESGVHATFMPKPLQGEFGSGLHLHLLFFAGERNLFAASRGRGGSLSELGSAFLAGVLAHAREFTAVTNQWVNSYKRLVPGFEAPESATWTREGRSGLVRLPSYRPGREHSARLELRSPDPSCNPYLTLALVLGAGLRGIERGYHLPPEDDAAGLTPPLPMDLREAVDAFEDSEFVRDILGDGVCDAFLRNKRAELAEHRVEVGALERRRLLRML